MRELLKGSLAHKLRLAHTALGVALAVGLVCGTVALSDTIEAAFRRAVAATHAGASVLVRAAPPFLPGDSPPDRMAVPESLLPAVQVVPGVDAAWGSVSGYAMVGGDGVRATQAGHGVWATQAGSGILTVGKAWTPGDILAAGRAPAVLGDVVIGQATAEAHNLRVGDRVPIVFQHGAAEFGVTGIASGEGSAAAAFDLLTAQALYDRVGRFDEVAVRAVPGVSAETLRGRVAAVVGDAYHVVTGGEVAAREGRSWRGALRFLAPGLLVFSALALLVSAFIIFNTFSILVAQRAREFGLVRVLGASRGQVMLTVLIEAGAVGAVASAAGVLLGFGAAHGLLALLQVAGFDLPDTSVVFRASTAAAGGLAGLVTTVAAAVLPAYRATSAAPVTAMRSQDGDTGGSLRRRWLIGFAVTLAGASEVLIGLHTNVRRPLLAVGLGAGALLVGLVMLAPLVARPVTQALGAPFARLLGQAAFLGRENAMRNPRRTAATAAALMVGFGLIGVVCTLAASMRASATAAIESSVRADLVVTPGFGPGVSPLVAERLRQTPGVAAVSPVRNGQFGIDDRAETVFAVDPATVTAMFEVGPSDAAALAQLTDGGVLVRDTVAARHGWHAGDGVPMTFARAGTTRLRLEGVFSTSTVRTDYVISLGTFEANYADQLDARVGIKLAPGTSLDAGRATVEAALSDLPGLFVMDRSELLADQRAQVNRFLVPVSALLGLSVVIGLLGIANTVALSVHERTGELGLLRALGMERRQLRSMIGVEAAIIAGLGTALGLVLALLFSWTLASALQSLGVTELVLPVGQLLRWAAATVTAAMVAAAVPARRAARLNVLEAVRH